MLLAFLESIAKIIIFPFFFPPRKDFVKGGMHKILC